jgi:hypothetical protein
MPSVTAASIRPHLQNCGYSLLRDNFPLTSELSVPLVAFANPPADARSACIAVVEDESADTSPIAAVRGLGAPVIFRCRRDGLEWWKQSPDAPERMGKTIPPADIPKFFEANKKDFSPNSVYRAKTWGRYDQQHQLWFVDLGLMPLVESEIGDRLVGLIVRNVDHLKSTLGWKVLNSAKSEWLLKAVFWMISAKILRDKSVGSFTALDLQDVSAIYDAVAKHFGTPEIEIANAKQHEAITELAEDIARFSSLELATTESLAHVYENTLISEATRKSLGTHSTPAYLVDYIVGRLRKSIEDIDTEDRNVFEPACGHGAFLVSAMRCLTELLPEKERTPGQRRSYLRKRLHGIDTDAFALEIARLSLSLTDIPNPNGWDLTDQDIFVGDTLEKRARKATILLLNPPFENFSTDDRKWYGSQEVEIQQTNKAAEVLRRVLPELPEGAAIGLVAPQGFLHSKDAADVRRVLLNSFDLQEVILFPDKVFEKADSEAVVILGTKHVGTAKSNSLVYSRIRERDYKEFTHSYRTSFQKTITQHSLAKEPLNDMRFAELSEVWEFCSTLDSIESIAELAQGFQFKGQSHLSPGTKTYQLDEFRNAKPAFIHFDSNLAIHLLPTEYWANLDDDVIQCWRGGTIVGKPQVLLNYAPVSRGPWRLKALIDRKGHAVASRLILVRPLSEDVPLEFLWALLNSPLANIFAFAHLTKRDNLVGVLRKLRIPGNWRHHDEVVSSVTQYFSLFAQKARPDKQTAKTALLNVEAAVLRLYEFPAHLERQILNEFSGYSRPGVPFDFDDYIPLTFKEDISLTDFLRITDDWPQINKRRERLIRKKVGKTISTEEKQELQELQQLATYRQRLIDPLPLAELERLSSRLARQN